MTSTPRDRPEQQPARGKEAEACHCRLQGLQVLDCYYLDEAWGWESWRSRQIADAGNQRCLRQSLCRLSTAGAQTLRFLRPSSVCAKSGLRPVVDARIERRMDGNGQGHVNIDVDVM